MNSEDMVDEPLRRISPFGEKLVKDEYFTGAGHLNILVNMRRDIAARVPMLILTGEDGCGKSVFGRMVAAEVRAGCIPVVFTHTVDSFEELVWTIAERVDVEVPPQSRDAIGDAVEKIAAVVARRNERLLVILDGAERIYLATLERLRKMMDRLNRVVVSMQVVLIGRPLLLDNLRQLSICNFEEIEEKYYVLEPLTQAETRSYFEFCKNKMPDTESAIFNHETVGRIYQGSLGNFKKIHALAEQLCNRYNKDASFWVLLENVEGGPQKKALRRVIRRTPLVEKLDLRQFSRRQKLIGVGGGAVALFLFFLLFTSGGEKPTAPELSNQDRVVEQAMVEDESEKQKIVSDPAALQKSEEVMQGDGGEGSVDEPIEATEKPAPMLADQAEPGAESLAPVESPEYAEDQGGNNGVVVEEAEQVETPVQKELLQAEKLVAEAQQAVETARKDDGKEIVAAPKTDHSSSTASTDGGGSAELPLDGRMVAEAIVMPEKPENVVEKSVPVAEEKIAEVRVIRPERVKIRAAYAEDEAERSRGEMGAVGHQPAINGGTETAVPLIGAGKTKKKNTVTDGGAGGAHSIQLQRANNSLSVDEPVTLMQRQVSATEDGRQPIEAETKKIPVLSKAIVPEKKVMTSSGTYPARVAAGVPWLDGKKDDKYTMQLMVLSSSSARESVRQILSQNEYSSEAGNLYVFEKRSGSPAVYVFMGEYDTLAEAQAARERIPVELQKHDPYVLSVPEALRKVK